MSNFLGISDKTFLVTGFANRKSVAWHVSNILEKEGANIIFTVRSDKRKDELIALKPNAEIFVCDFEKPNDISALKNYLEEKGKGHLLEYFIRLLMQTMRKDFVLFMKLIYKISCKPPKYHHSR